MFQKKIVLASKSPRRRFLLEQAKIPFTVDATDVVEKYPDVLSPEYIPVFLATLKAREAAKIQDSEIIILAADSVVIIDGEVLGKPKNENEAKEMLLKLSGREHVVITGVCIIHKNGESIFSDTSTVKFKDLEESEIDYYVSEFQPLDKAGGYGIQDWIGWCKIEWIKGSYANIMGLPVHRVYEELKKIM